MLKKNDEFTAEVLETGCNGEGIVKIDGCPVFVPYSLRGEIIKLKILKAKPSFAFGKLIEVLKPSDRRVSPVCPVFYKCGGCNLQHLDYDSQLRWKGESVCDCFKKIAGISLDVPAAEGSESTFRYRNKLQLPIRQTKNGVSIGFFREGTHDVINIADCPIQRKWVSDVIEVFHRYVKMTGEPCFNEETCRGNLKHAVVREVSGIMLIVAVCVSGRLKNAEVLVSLLKEKFNEFSLFVNKNDLNNNVVMGREFTLICGKEKVVSDESGVKMPMGPESFMQVNDEVRKKIYLKVCELAGSGNSTVIDAYSGAGFLTAQLAGNADRVYGIECVAEAVDCADKLARENGLDGKITNVCGLCEDVLPDLIDKTTKQGDRVTVVLDPPRKGCDRAVTEALIKSRPDRIVYVSCNPSTLARDVGILTGKLEYVDSELKKSAQTKELYSIEFIQPYDMFPQTKHVETVVCLSRTFDN